MKKHASLIIGILFIGIVCLMADFQVSTALADGSGFILSDGTAGTSESPNELPPITDDAIFQNLTIYTAPDVTADCKNILALLLAETPPAFLPPYLNIELHSAPLTEFHGLSAAGTIKLNCNLPESRLREVFYHELGHVIYDDLDEERKIIFEERVAAYAANGAPNYITQYALTNADEDFADSFMMYMTRREVFEKKAEKSAALKKKYESIDFYPELLYNSSD